MNSENCPYCGAKAVDVTTAEDSVKYFLCTGEDQHRFTFEHDEIEPESKRTPLIILATR